MREFALRIAWQVLIDDTRHVEPLQQRVNQSQRPQVANLFLGNGGSMPSYRHSSSGVGETNGIERSKEAGSEVHLHRKEMVKEGAKKTRPDGF
jgi:hypothetical protein